MSNSQDSIVLMAGDHISENTMVYLGSRCCDKTCVVLCLLQVIGENICEIYETD